MSLVSSTGMRTHIHTHTQAWGAHRIVRSKPEWLSAMPAATILYPAAQHHLSTPALPSWSRPSIPPHPHLNLSAPSLQHCTRPAQRLVYGYLPSTCKLRQEDCLMLAWSSWLVSLKKKKNLCWDLPLTFLHTSTKASCLKTVVPLSTLLCHRTSPPSL